MKDLPSEDVRALVRGEEIQRTGLKSWWPAEDGIDLGIGKDGMADEKWVRDFLGIPRVRTGTIAYRTYAFRQNYEYAEVIFRFGDDRHEAVLVKYSGIGYALVDSRLQVRPLSTTWLAKVAPRFADFLWGVLVTGDNHLKAQFPQQG